MYAFLVAEAGILDAAEWCQFQAIARDFDAKRYLCATDAAYYDRLSADSKRSLMLQGGIFNASDAAAFIARPHAADAVRLRLWDDLAKDAAMVTPDLPYFTALKNGRMRSYPEK